MPKTKPPYSEEFRREAVDLYVSSGRSLKGVAEDLGVSTNSLRSWKQALLGGAQDEVQPRVSGARTRPERTPSRWPRRSGGFAGRTSISVVSARS
ncbi:MAG: transposase [Verrucomicrobiales bacterium]